MKAGFCLNPFSMIDAARAAEDEDYRLDCFGMVKAIIGQMARHSAALDAMIGIGLRQRHMP